MNGGMIVMVAAAVAAFAGNSLIARAAIGLQLIEPGAFSTIRLAAGALVLLPLIGRLPRPADLPGGIALLVYMLGFSFAYSDLPTATGALILFASVQFTVIALGITKGDRLGGRGALGVALACAGIAWLLAPSAAAPPPIPTLIMAAAGIAWGVYTHIGRGSTEPIGQTARSFLIAALLSAPAGMLDYDGSTLEGVGLAVFAGVVTSALGYALWYKVAPRLGLGLAAGSQLATPIVAALGAAALLSEPLTWRVGIAAAIVLGGIFLTIKPAPPPRSGSRQ
jgi:drug/metabolite transporter (DMT)-like permease